MSPGEGEGECAARLIGMARLCVLKVGPTPELPGFAESRGSDPVEGSFSLTVGVTLPKDEGDEGSGETGVSVEGGW
jgi:hypothetical protein